MRGNGRSEATGRDIHSMSYNLYIIYIYNIYSYLHIPLITFG